MKTRLYHYKTIVMIDMVKATMLIPMITFQLILSILTPPSVFDRFNKWGGFPPQCFLDKLFNKAYQSC